MSSVLSVGRIDEAGFLKGLHRKGFTIHKALAELFANCLDAGANNIHFAITRTGVRISDNGVGMTEAGLANMFAMHRENHSGAPRRGVSGVGKSSYVLLSKDRPMMVFTRTAGGDYLCAVVPWDRMFAEGRYSSMITVSHMTEEEHAAFTAEHPDGHGTTVALPYHKELANAIRDSFPIGKVNEAPAMDRLGVIFGNDDFTATLKDMAGNIEVINKYNYFALSDAEYMCGRSSWRIEHYQLNINDDPEEREKDRFLLVDGDRYLEIMPAKRGYAKEPAEARANLENYNYIGFYTVVVGLREDAVPLDKDENGPLVKYTDDKTNNQIEPYIRNTELASPLDMEIFGKIDKVMKGYLPNVKVVRNGQKVGCYMEPDFGAGSARGTPESMLTYWSLQVELRYNPTSEQDNPQDKLIGIQENKNQYIGDGLPSTLTRLIKYCRFVKGKEICDHLKEQLEEIKRKRNATVPTHTVGVAVSKTDEDEEVDEDEDNDADENEDEDEDADADADEDADSAEHNPAESVVTAKGVVSEGIVAESVVTTENVVKDVNIESVELVNDQLTVSDSTVIQHIEVNLPSIPETPHLVIQPAPKTKYTFDALIALINEKRGDAVELNDDWLVIYETIRDL